VIYLVEQYYVDFQLGATCSLVLAQSFYNTCQLIEI
jgi:hypothetical protein